MGRSRNLDKNLPIYICDLGLNKWALRQALGVEWPRVRCNCPNGCKRNGLGLET